MSSYKVGQVAALLSKGARDKKFEKIFYQSNEKPFAEFLKKKDVDDQSPGKPIKKSKKKFIKSQNSLVTPRTLMSEYESNSSPRLVVKCKQKKRKFEDVGTINEAPVQSPKKQKKSPPVPGILAVEEPSESGAMDEKVKVKAANKKKNKRMAKILSADPEEMDAKSCVANQILQKRPLNKGKKVKKNLKVKSKSAGGANNEVVKLHSDIKPHKASGDSEGEDMDNEKNSSLYVTKKKAANEKKNKRKAKVLSNPKEVNIKVVSQILQDSPLKKGKKKLKVKSRQKSNSKIVESRSDVRPNLEDEDLGEEMPKDDSDFISASKTKFYGFDGREDNPERLQRTVCIGNLPTTADRYLLKILFRPFGRVESVRIQSVIPPKESMEEKVANIRKEYHENCYSLIGFVVFVKKEDAENALSLNGSIVQNHHIKVDLSSNRKNLDSECSVFVGNLPFDINEDKMWSAFSECGTVKSVRVVRDRETGVGKGFGFVQFEDKETVDEALELNETKVFGRNIRVKIVDNVGKGKNERSPNAPKKKWNNYKKASPLDKRKSNRRGIRK